jgi:hypothetical protein
MGSGFARRRNGILRHFNAQSEKAAMAPFTAPPPPPVLYHYTGWLGLERIVSDQNMAATAHYDLDRELRIAETWVDEIVAELQAAASPRAAVLLGTFCDRYGNRRAADHLKIFLTCFSTTRDDCLLWERFAKNDGACLAFNTIVDGEALPPLHMGMPLARSHQPVDYNPTTSKDRIRRGFKSILDVFEELPRRNRAMMNAAGEEAILNLILVACLAAITSKPPGDHPEAEWRYVAFPDPSRMAELGKIILKDGRGRDFLPLRFRAPGKRLSLNEVIVFGPDPNAARSHAEEILKEAGYHGAELPPVRASAHCKKK